MTTYGNIRQERPRSYGALLALVAIGAFVFGALLATLRTPVGRIATDTHAVERHGSEAETIRRCLEQRGPDMVWAKRDDPSVKVFCVNLDETRGCGRWGALFAQFFPSHDTDYRELTAFCPRSGKYHDVVRYLSRFAKRIR